MRSTIEATKRRSDDINTQTATVLTTADGDIVLCASNTLPHNCDKHPTRQERPGKVPYIEHSERNVIYAAAAGIKTSGLHMHMDWFPCAECARAIIQAGIAELHCDAEPADHPQYNFKAAGEMLRESLVVVTEKDY